MGALGSIAASRIARAFHFGGPSHTVCSEEGSSARAIELGVRALRAGELDRVLVGGVDLAGDPRTVLAGNVERPGEGAVAFVLKRLKDAVNHGDRIYAAIRGVGVAADEQTALARAEIDAGIPFDQSIRFSAADDVGETGAASGGASLAKACIALFQEILPGSAVNGSPGNPRYWLQDRASGPRRATVSSSGAEGSHFAFLIEEHARNAELKSTPERTQPIGGSSGSRFRCCREHSRGTAVGFATLPGVRNRTRNTSHRGNRTRLVPQIRRSITVSPCGVSGRPFSR